MIEVHPFLSFVPKDSKYLLLGSFPGTTGKDNPEYWFYGTRTTQFWSIFENIYNIKLKTRKSKEELFSKLKLAISDVIYSAERKSNNSSDLNLIKITYNNEVIEEILSKNKIQKIFFTSAYTATKYKTKFKDLITKHPKIKLITLPSPSPRYAMMTKQEKIKRYRNLLPFS